MLFSDNKIEAINEILLRFTDNLIDINALNYDVIEHNYIIGWNIKVNDEYTQYVFFTEQKTLCRKLKIDKLL